MRSKILIITFFISVLALKGQQIVMFNHYFYKPMVNNPAYTGMNETPHLMLINHTQWSGFKGGPQYNLLSFDGTILNKNTGLGVVISSDRKGVNNRIGGNVSYSYKIRFKEKIFLQLGLALGAINQSIDYSKAGIENPNDPSLFINSQNKTTFDANAGLVFVAKGLELGFAVPQIANNKINYVSYNDSRTFYTQSRHYMGSLKYQFTLPKKTNISISPQILTRYLPNAPIQYDANINVDWQNKFWIGATYKNNYAIGLNLGVTLFKKLSIGYSYDYITGSINKYSGLSHEIMLSFKFNKKKTENKTDEQKEDDELKKLSDQDLNKILIERIERKVEALLDKGNATQQEIHELLDEIASFLDSESNDPSQDILKKYYNSLKNQAQGDINVLVKGKIILGDNSPDADYSKIKITVLDVATKKIAGTSVPTKDGKYFIILKPAKKYQITVECEGYKLYTKAFNVSGSPESYEMSQEIILSK